MWGRRKKEPALVVVDDVMGLEIQPASSDPSGLDPRIVDTTSLFLDRLYQNYYDFIDLGTCDGGGFEIAKCQGGRRGLGFDIEPTAVIRGLDKGLDVACYDVCALESVKPTVDFTICSHILEHLPSIASVRSVIDAAARMSRDYLLISGPCFEEESYLLDNGVKLLHSLMLDHTCKFKIIELVTMLHELQLRDYTICLTERIEDTSNHWVHAQDQHVPPFGLWTYDETKHDAKPQFVFDREIYRDFVCVVPLRDGIDSGLILKQFMWGYDKIAFQSSWGLFGAPGRPR